MFTAVPREMPITRQRADVRCATPADAKLCSGCQDKVNPRDVQLELYGMVRHTTARLYFVPVLEGVTP